MQNDLKTPHIATLAGNIQAPTVKALFILLEMLIAETRVDNDTATVEEFRKNQGKIEGYKNLRDYITRPPIK